MENLPEKWTGKLVGQMHNNRVTRQELADEIGVTKQYVVMILNGHRSPRGAREMLEVAYKNVLEKRAEDRHEC